MKDTSKADKSLTEHAHTQLRHLVIRLYFPLPMKNFKFFFFFLKKMPLRNLFQVKDGSKGHWRVTMNCELNE